MSVNWCFSHAVLNLSILNLRPRNHELAGKEVTLKTLPFVPGECQQPRQCKMVTNWPVNRGGSASNVLQPWNAKLASSLAMLRRGRYDTINETNLKMLSKKKCRSREFISKFGSCLLSLSLKYTHMDSTLWITERGQYGADVIRKRQLSSLVGVSIVHGHGHMDTLV